jgi:phage protein D
MFKYVTVDFPFSIVKPSLVYEFSLKQTRYEHEYAVLLFKDWEISYDDIAPMSPVTISLFTPEGFERSFNGYVHHIKPLYSPGERSVEIHVIGASYVMKNTSQTIYTNVTADQVLRKIARKYEFSYFAEPHERVFPQIAQAGRTDWQLLVWLAKKVGYTLRAENTSLYFYPLSKDYSENRSSAKSFTLNSVERLGGTNTYSFKPVVGEHLYFDNEEDDVKSALAYSGVDRFAQIELQYTKQKAKTSTRKNKTPEQFDRFAVNTVVPDSEVAKWESEAAEERQRFGYRGHAEVLGDPTIRPDLPIYLKGVGSEYSGYWVVISVEHKIERVSLNDFTYISNLYLGIDSLGKPNSWGAEPSITAPNKQQIRVIKPNVRNTQKKDKSKLKVKGFYNKKKSTGSLVKLANKKVSESPKWSSSIKDLKTPTPTGKYKPPVVVNRLLSR